MIDINNKKFKLAFFWTLVAMFFMTSSLLILYAFGYTFNPERGIFVHAGSITVKSNPLSIEVILNDANVSKKLNRINSSINIGRVKPGEYILKVEAPDFNTWSKKISVHSGLSTEFWNVLLTRKEYARENHGTEGIDDFFISPRKNLVAGVKTENGRLSITITNTDTNTSETAFTSADHSFTQDPEENIEWAPQSQKIIVPLMSGEEKLYLIADLDSKENIMLDELAGTSDISSVRWDSENKNVVYFITEGNLYRLDIKEPQDKKIIASNIAGYDISGQYIYYFQLPGGLIFRTNLEATSEPLQITTSAPSKMEDPSYKIIVYDEKRIALRNGSGRLFIFNKGEKDSYFKELLADAKGSQFSNDGKKLLFWNNREIYAYFTKDWQTQPYRSENETISITRFSQPLKNVQWSNDYEHVIFSVNGQLKITELDHRDNTNTFDIANFSGSDQKVVSNFSQGRIYFTDNVAEGPRVLQSIQFPEKASLLGF
ncbi:MAG: hypothetical protein UY41_C0001G0015 [Candidatus Moranbacteria bacterium GW2011_GWE1_49_15]|nr:MAG: hypothetical protein UX75_C0006G0004 [Candidatus Moranbacteria bacterium GW2011_GWE2_47_10]KKW07587.1 MAG: hypothetical protein UY41_C0001G0015 [Candidatus Moranbacteria bacterium GW2011_GWE1_49_15]HBP01081.1 hypothetical protein [Candidatus Moranbacteria bacterium]